MIRKAMPIIAAVCFVTMLVIAAYAYATMPPKPGSYGDSNTAEVLVLDGVWQSEVSNGTQFKALIKNGNIEINLEAPDTTALYWQGTFPWNAGDDSIVSVANKEALDGSLLGSSEADKLFTYNGDTLSFKFGAMGVSTIVKMKKV